MRRYIVSLLALLSLVPIVASAQTYTPKTRVELLKCEKVQSKYSKRVYSKGDKVIRSMGLNWALCIKEDQKKIDNKPQEKTAVQIQLEREAENMRLYGNPIGLVAMPNRQPVQQNIPKVENIQQSAPSINWPIVSSPISVPVIAEQKPSEVTEIKPQEVKEESKTVYLSGSGSVLALNSYVSGNVKIENTSKVPVTLKKISFTVEGSDQIEWYVQSYDCRDVGACGEVGMVYKNGNSSGQFDISIEKNLEPGETFVFRTFAKSLKWPSSYLKISVDSIEGMYASGNGVSSFGG